MSDVTAGLQVTGIATVQRASSSCCGAKLDIGGEGAARYWLCRECRQPCDKVMTPEEIGFHG